MVFSFGIHIALSYFATMINGTLKGLDFCFAYLEDIMIYSTLEKEHLDHTHCILITYAKQTSN